MNKEEREQLLADGRTLERISWRIRAGLKNGSISTYEAEKMLDVLRDMLAVLRDRLDKADDAEG
jgi:hypothetical protein